MLVHFMDVVLVSLFRNSRPEVFCKKVVFFLRRCSVKKVFLKDSQNSQESTCSGSLVSSFKPEEYFGTERHKRPWYRCFPINFAKFLRTPFFIEHLRWLVLFIVDFLKIVTHRKHAIIFFNIFCSTAKGFHIICSRTKKMREVFPLSLIFEICFEGYFRNFEIS